MRKTTLLRKMIMDDEILVMPGSHDACSAIIIEQIGFKAVAMGGSSASSCLIGKPDVSLLTMTEMVNHLRNIVAAVDIPVFTDGDTGHGNVINVIRTTKEFERAGAAGYFIEDQVFPKRCGHTEGKQVIPTEEMIPKIKAAVDARVDQDFVIMARTDALAIYGVDAAIERANRYVEAGADMILVEAPTNVEEMRKICKEVKAPNMANMIDGGKTPIKTTTNELQDIGYKVVCHGCSTIHAAAYGVRRVMEELYQKGTTAGYGEKMITLDQLFKLLGIEEIRATEAHYYKDLLACKK